MQSDIAWLKGVKTPQSGIESFTIFLKHRVHTSTMRDACLAGSAGLCQCACSDLCKPACTTRASTVVSVWAATSTHVLLLHFGDGSGGIQCPPVEQRCCIELDL